MNSPKVKNNFLKQLSAVRQKKLLRLRNKIVSGKYRISNEALAKALFMAQ